MLVIADRCGGLCNRLWTLANVVAWGLEHRRTVVSLGFEEFAARFPGLETPLRVPGWVAPAARIPLPARHAPRALWRLAYRVNLRAGAYPHLALRDHESLDLDSAPAHRQLARARLVFLTGLYHLATESLDKHAEEIRRLFRPHEPARSAAGRVVSEARLGADPVVGVHIRHGDYRTFCDGLMFYSTGEYADLMRHLAAGWPDRKVSFVVCSDEEQPAEAFEGLRVHHGPGDPLGDLQALALCDYIVGPPSTFSRWASFWGRTPLWMMEWRAAERQGGVATKRPDPSDFSISRSASHQVDRGTLQEWRSA